MMKIIFNKSNSKYANAGSFLNKEELQYITEYSQLNSNWFDKQLLKQLFYALVQLRSYIENPNDNDITWENPFCELQYSVEIDWEVIKNNRKSYEINFTNTSLNVIESLSANKLKEILNNIHDIVLFRYYSNDSVLITENDISYILLPYALQERFKSLHNEDEQKEFILEYTRSEFIFEFQDFNDLIQPVIDDFLPNLKTKINHNYKHIDEKMFLTIGFGGLVIDCDLKKAYYPINIGLNIPFFKYNYKILGEELTSFWDALFTSLENYLQTLEQKEVLPSRTFNHSTKNKDTFAMPSNSMMLALIGMFAGKPNVLPRKLLDKPYNERTKEEIEEADAFLSSIFETQINYSYDANGKVNKDEKKIVLISNSPKVEAKADIDLSLFSSDLHSKEENLAIYIKRTFRAEGFRHLLGILIGLDEFGRTGEFVWSVNEHLNRIGYKKRQNGSYDYEDKQTALEIVSIFTSFYITTSTRDDKGTGKIKGKRLFYIEGFEKDYKDNWVVDEKFTIKATDFWYNDSFSKQEGSSQQFTKLLKGIAHENHRLHSITIYLTPLLAVFWRLKPNEVRELSVKNLFEWCDIPTKQKKLREELRNVEKELNYMKEKNYLGDWKVKNSDVLPSVSDSPLQCILVFYPPDWLIEEFKSITSKSAAFLESKFNKEQHKSTTVMSKEELQLVINNSGLSNRQFSIKAGISPSAITRYLKGERVIKKELSIKLRALFSNAPSVDKTDTN